MGRAAACASHAGCHAHSSGTCCWCPLLEPPQASSSHREQRAATAVASSTCGDRSVGSSGEWRVEVRGRQPETAVGSRWQTLAVFEPISAVYSTATLGSARILVTKSKRAPTIASRAVNKSLRVCGSNLTTVSTMQHDLLSAAVPAVSAHRELFHRAMCMHWSNIQMEHEQERTQPRSVQ